MISMKVSYTTAQKKIKNDLTRHHRDKSSWTTGNCVRYAEQVAIGKVSRTRKSSKNSVAAGDDERKAW